MSCALRGQAESPSNLADPWTCVLRSESIQPATTSAIWRAWARPL